MVTLDHDPGAVGDVWYLSTTAGQATATAPSGNTDIVRVVGYCLDASNGQIYFNPDAIHLACPLFCFMLMISKERIFSRFE